MRIFISTGEPSGDLHAANLIHSIRQRRPDAEFVGFGGDHMKRAGATLLYPLVELAVMWVLRVLLNIHKFLGLLFQADRYFRDVQPDVVVLIDYPGFNWWIARRAKARGIPVVYYVPPQIWAWAGWRVKKVRRFVDRVLCSLPFEPKWYHARGVPGAVYVGHPYFDELAERPVDDRFVAEQRAQGGPIVAILPGSRTQEVTRNFPVMLKAAQALAARRPDVRFVVACLHDRHRALVGEILATSGAALRLELFAAKTPELIRLADVAWAVSGSVALELMVEALPSVVLYKLNRIDLWIARPFIKVKYISLVNLLADAALFPEYLTAKDVSGELAEWARTWLDDPARRAEAAGRLAALRDRVAVPGASERAADQVVELAANRLRAKSSVYRGIHEPGGKVPQEDAGLRPIEALAAWQAGWPDAIIGVETAVLSSVESASMSAPDHPANRLAGETSPYLLQHAHNPVDWHPWGAEALERARREDRPIFLSIGYSACHWCHVMERECFENPDIAGLMNEHFVNIKVDREERPDLDQIYMAAVQAMTDHGGWPMSVFLTPDLKPFYGGTYFPPMDSRGMPGFPRVLLSVHRAWLERREEILTSAGEMTERLRMTAVIPAAQGTLELRLLEQAAHGLVRAFDPVHGGFGSAPKFPHPMDLRVLLRHHARTGDPQSLQIVRHTLDKMSRGGIYDHLGGGFARYSTDDRWLVPHFEKMLYDNALLSLACLETFQTTGDPEYARVARETMDYVLTRMTGPDGGIYSTEDADSEGEEGKYYVWTLAEIKELLGPERAKIFAYVYDVSERGNWEEKSILNLPKSISQAAKLLGLEERALRESLQADRARLLEARQERVPPGKDTKVLTSWNGLMLAPLAEGARILGDERYLEAAARAAAFLLDRLRTGDGRLLHSFKDGQAKFNGYLDDYANLIDGLTRLYEVSGAARWLESAADLAKVMIEEFADAADGGFFYTGKSHEELIVRQKDFQDNATPSGSAMAATALARLGALTGRENLVEAARSTLESMQVYLDRAPMAMGQSLIALDFLLATPKEFAVFAGGDPAEFRAVLEAVYGPFLPHKVVAAAAPGTVPAPVALVPLLAARSPLEDRTTTYICERSACLAPVVGVAGVQAALAPVSKGS